jgi:hypothetical protein
MRRGFFVRQDTSQPLWQAPSLRAWFLPLSEKTLG